MIDDDQNLMVPILETQRLILRELQLTDASALFQFLSDIDVSRYYDPAPMAYLEQARQSISRHRAGFIRGERIRWGVTLKGNNTVVGTCGFFWDRSNFRGEISYALAKNYWRHGLMTEALTAMLRWGFVRFTDWPLNRVEANVAAPNIASMRLLQLLGFQSEGVSRQRMYVEDRFIDEFRFALLRDEYLRHQRL